MSGRNLGKALRCGDGPLKNITRVSSHRKFSSSVIHQRHGAIPKFAKTSSPELDNILSTFRTKIILPAHLSKQQQDLIYKASKQKILNSETITAQIGDEEFKLEHIDRTKDIPRTWKTVLDAIQLMEEKRDWDRLPNLLQGLRSAGRILKKPYSLMIIRRAAAAGRMDVMLECARRVKDTGVRLNDPDLVARIMWGFQYKAIKSGFTKNDTKKALSWAEMILLMLEEERHTGGPLKDDPRTKLEVIGAPLQLAAVRASRHLNRNDEGGLVAKYAERILRTSLLYEAPGASSVEEHSSKLGQTRFWLLNAIPTLHGMRVAQTVLGANPDLAKQLKAFADALQVTVDAQRSSLRGKFGTGYTARIIKWYDEQVVANA